RAAFCYRPVLVSGRAVAVDVEGERAGPAVGRLRDDEVPDVAGVGEGDDLTVGVDRDGAVDREPGRGEQGVGDLADRAGRPGGDVVDGLRAAVGDRHVLVVDGAVA